MFYHQLGRRKNVSDSETLVLQYDVYYFWVRQQDFEKK